MQTGLCQAQDGPATTTVTPVMRSKEIEAPVRTLMHVYGIFDAGIRLTSIQLIIDSTPKYDEPNPKQIQATIAVGEPNPAAPVAPAAEKPKADATSTTATPATPTVIKNSGACD